MSFLRAIIMASAARAPIPAAEPGQVQWSDPGSVEWIVPDGVFAISPVVVGGGGGGPPAGAIGPTKSYPGGGGGGLHWRNDVAVTPGESLTITVGAGGQQFPAATNGAASFIARTLSGEILVRAYGGGRAALSAGGRVGGGNDTAALGGGGGVGGIGGAAVSGGYAAGGGGAAGYVGNGGAGGGGAPSTGIDGVGTAGAGQPPSPPYSGGGQGGGGTDDGTGGLSGGQGVGLEGRTSTFAPGSLGTPQLGAGGAYAGEGAQGGARIMWGAGRSYPDDAADYDGSTPPAEIAYLRLTNGDNLLVSPGSYFTSVSGVPRLIRSLPVLTDFTGEEMLALVRGSTVRRASISDLPE